MSRSRQPAGLRPASRALDNGVNVIAKANRTTPAVSLLIGVGCGAYDDPPGGDGTAALCARVLDRGTTTRSADTIADDLDRRGASLSVAAGRHQIALAATCLADDFATVLALAADIVRHPAFPEPEVATRRDTLITSIRQAEDDPASVAVDAFAAALYGAHPYARCVRGTVASVAALDRAALVTFHQRFAAAPVTVVIVGDVDETAAIDAVSAAMGDWRRTIPSASWPLDVPAAAPAASRRLVTVPMPDKSQADVAYGFVGVRRLDPDFTAISVMNNALGQYAIGGRLGDSIRERQGMAYYVFSALDASFGEGPLVVRAGVATENIERTIASIDAELRAVIDSGLTAQEVDESKSYLIGSLPRQLETNAAIAAFLLSCQTFGLGLDYDQRLPAMIAAVDKAAADAAARRLLAPERATITVAGPAGSSPTP